MMKRLLPMLLVVACARPSTSTTTIRIDAATPLQIVVLDDYSSRPSCDGIVPRKLEVIVDGRPAGVVEIPCRTTTAMPPLQIMCPTITVAAGSHTVVAREVGLGNSVEQQLELPVIVSSAEDGTDELATKLPVWASDDALQVMQVAVKITFDAP